MRKNNYRYPGTKPFTSEETNLFFGRDNDIQNLAQYIKLEKQIVLYGKSGLGKTSLLNAGVIPKLRDEEKYFPINIRFGAYNSNPTYTPTDILKQNLINDIAFDNFLWQKLIPNNENNIVSKQFENHEYLWYYFKSLQIQHEDKNAFLIIFDQFEELFTYPPNIIKQFEKAFSEIMNIKVPQYVRNHIKLQDKNILTRYELQQLNKDLNVKVVYAIRSDKMSFLNRLKDYFPDILQKTFELTALTEDQAKEAITMPSAIKDKNFISKSFSYSNDAINNILSFLSKNHKEKIESFQLQIICQYVEDLIINKKTRCVNAIHLANISNIYKNFYDNLIGKLSDEEQEKAKILIEEGLIFEEEERRISLYEGQINSVYKVDSELLRKLVNTHLLRAEPNPSGGFSYELSHDTLVAPILDSKKTHELLKYDGLTRKAFEEQNRLKKLVEEQTYSINKQRQEITDSISYAKRIQDSLLTPIKYIDKILQEYFIINRSRDIVSGDFYWVKKIDNSVIVVVADCTGHGVPGAMVSMLGMSFLKEIFREEKIIPSDEVLNRLRENLIQTLHQTGDEGQSKDGMDLSLGIINFDNLSFQFSGAFNPVWIVRNSEVIELKADRMPIAIYHQINPFSKQEFQLQANDAIYFFTDGYTDQFGGENQRKFMRKNFKKLLIEIQNSSMKEQQSILDKVYFDWKGDYEQIDDVLVMGIKI